MEALLGRYGLNRGTRDVLAALRRDGAPYCLSPTVLYRSLMRTSVTMTHRLGKPCPRANAIARVHDGDAVGDHSVRDAQGTRMQTWWARAAEVWPDYDNYQAATERAIPLFVHEPSR